jgi:hypothetical protein
MAEEGALVIDGVEPTYQFSTPLPPRHNHENVSPLH